MNKIKLLLIVWCCTFCVCFVPTGAAQQENRPVAADPIRLTLDLDQYVQKVLQAGPDMKLYAKDLDEAAANRQQAWATALPKVSLSAGYNRNLKDNFMYISLPGMSEQKFKINYKNEFSWQAAVNQPLFSFKVGAALQAAKEYEKLVDSGYRQARIQVHAAARKLFYQVLLLEKVVEVMTASERNARENYDLMDKRYQAGQVSRLQLLQAESRHKSTVPELIRAQRNLDLAMNSLKNLAGIPLDQAVVLQGDLERLPPLPQEASLNDTLPRRPDFERMIWQEKLQLTGIRAQKAEGLPSLDLNLAYNFSAQSDLFKTERQNNAYVVGLSMKFPIYTGGYLSAQIKKADIDLQRTRLKMERMRTDIDKDLRDARLSLTGARKALEAAQTSLKAAAEAFTVTEVTVANGLSTQLELKDARLLYDQAQLGYFNAGFDYLCAVIDWEVVSAQESVAVSRESES